jgi:hypothetical protein
MKVSSGFRFKPDIFHPDYNPGEYRKIRISEKKKISGSIRIDPDTDRSTNSGYRFFTSLKCKYKNCRLRCISINETKSLESL